MHTDDESLDDPVLPDDILASDEEIVAAVQYARSDSGGNRRLLEAAKFILARSKQLKRMCEPEDLLQDAIEAVLDGRRKWRTNRVDFKGLVVGGMRSMVSSRDTTITAKLPDVKMEHELELVGEDQQPPTLEAFSADSKTTEDVVLEKEQDALEKSRMAILCAQYEPGGLHRRILEKVMQGFSSHAEIYEALGVEESVYRNAWKALMRAAKAINESAEE